MFINTTLLQKCLALDQSPLEIFSAEIFTQHKVVYVPSRYNNKLWITHLQTLLDIYSDECIVILGGTNKDLLNIHRPHHIQHIHKWQQQTMVAYLISSMLKA